MKTAHELQVELEKAIAKARAISKAEKTKADAAAAKAVAREAAAWAKADAARAAWMKAT